METTYNKVVDPKVGVICELADNQLSGLVRMTSGGRERNQVFEFSASTRRRVCQIGLTKRDGFNTQVGQSDDSNPLIWVPVDSPFRTSAFPEDGKVFFEFRFVYDLETKSKVKAVGSWASYDESLYVLTSANAAHILIRDNCGKRLWTGMYGLGTGCRVDGWGTFPTDLFSCGEIYTVVSGGTWPVDSKRKVYNDLRNAQVLVAEPEEEQRTTGRRIA